MKYLFQDLDDLQAELIKLKLWTEEKCKERNKSRTSMETSIETNMERQTEKMAEWDIVTEFIGAELAEFYRECEVS